MFCITLMSIFTLIIIFFTTEGFFKGFRGTAVSATTILACYIFAPTLSVIIKTFLQETEWYRSLDHKVSFSDRTFQDIFNYGNTFVVNLLLRLFSIIITFIILRIICNIIVKFTTIINIVPAAGIIDKILGTVFGLIKASGIIFIIIFIVTLSCALLHLNLKNLIDGNALLMTLFYCNPLLLFI